MERPSLQPTNTAYIEICTKPFITSRNVRVIAILEYSIRRNDHILYAIVMQYDNVRLCQQGGKESHIMI